MSRKKSHDWGLKTDIIMVSVGVILFILGVTLPLPNVLKIILVIAGIGLLALFTTTFPF